MLLDRLIVVFYWRVIQVIQVLSFNYIYNFFFVVILFFKFFTDHGKVCDEGGADTESSRVLTAAILSGLKGWKMGAVQLPPPSSCGLCARETCIYLPSGQMGKCSLLPNGQRLYKTPGVLYSLKRFEGGQTLQKGCKKYQSFSIVKL